MSIKFAKRAASSLLNRGYNSIRIKHESMKEASDALTKEDIRKLISSGVIYATKAKHNLSLKSKMLKKARAEGRRRGAGRRRGTANARSGRKWEKKVRSQRMLIKELKSMKKIDTKVFNEFYSHIKGNEYATKATVLLHLREQGITVTDDDINKINEKARSRYK
jgi:large subunit ribosomal protein L19e